MFEESAFCVPCSPLGDDMKVQILEVGSEEGRVQIDRHEIIRSDEIDDTHKLDNVWPLLSSL